jgi:pimeloyl-ACP methyl ester carboxylesterase
MKGHSTVGYSRNGLPYNRSGHGSRIAVIFQGLYFENKPITGIGARYALGMYRFLEPEYTVYLVTRRPGMPQGYIFCDMANDYAVMIRQEFGGPVDVIGLSTGGSIVQHFAADHPDLVRRLVIHSGAYTLCEESRQRQMRVAHLARRRKWRQSYTELFSLAMPPMGFNRVILPLGAFLMSLSPPKDPSDLVVTIEAEDVHNFKDRLGEIQAPTLVVGGSKDPCYTE